MKKLTHALFCPSGHGKANVALAILDNHGVTVVSFETLYKKVIMTNICLKSGECLSRDQLNSPCA